MSIINSFEGTIYKLFCYDKDVKACYVGSTKNLKRRLKDHKCNTNCKRRRDHKSILYQTIRDTGGWTNWSYQILAKVRVNNYTELHKFEALFIKSTENTLNKIIPTRSRKQHYEEEKERILAYKKSYHQNNRDKISKRRKEKYEQNKKAIRIKQKAYYDLNRDKIRERRSLPKYWIDGTQTTVASSRIRHLKSKKHKESMQKFTQMLRDHLALKFPHLSCMD